MIKMMMMGDNGMNCDELQVCQKKIEKQKKKSEEKEEGSKGMKDSTSRFSLI